MSRHLGQVVVACLAGLAVVEGGPVEVEDLVVACHYHGSLVGTGLAGWGHIGKPSCASLRGEGARWCL